MNMELCQLFAVILIILSTVIYGPEQFIVKDLMAVNATRQILGFGSNSKAQITVPSERQFFTPCHDNNIYCESYTGYPVEHMKLVLEQHPVPKDFFVGDDPPLEIANRWEEQDVTPCSSFTATIFPTMGRNKLNKWKLIFNDPSKQGYIQSVRVEICRERDRPCSFIYREGYQSQCKQKYIYRRLVALGDLGRPAMDMIKLPSGCECVLRRNFNWQQRSMLPRNYV